MWNKAPDDVELDSDHVHVWRANLDQPAWRIQQLAQTLSADEQERAERHRFEHLRRRFIVGRGVLRTVLSSYLRVLPSQIQFGYGPQGKPRLAEPLTSLHFNLAHSHELALYAVTPDRAVGVDIEQVRPLDNAAQLAERFFSPQEAAALRAVPAEQRLEAFFTCWTRKEAYIKARGGGLSIPLNQFDVSLTLGEPARLVASRIDRRDPDRWSLYALVPAPGYVATLAVEGYGWRLACWQWS
jgi:4'-phosphopantetheinyl transferase